MGVGTTKKGFAETVQQGFEGREILGGKELDFDDDVETVSHSVKFHKKRKDALQKLFRARGLDLGAGIRMVLYEWLDGQIRKGLK